MVAITSGRDDFARAILLADWACYPAPEHRADEARMTAVVNAFPPGFTLYAAEARGRLCPVGYTGWYPLEPAAFAALMDQPETLNGRGALRPAGPFRTGAPVYLFNYSLVPSLHKTAASRRLLTDYAATLAALPHGGLCAVTISPAGARFATRMGLTARGWLVHDGEAERVYGPA